MTDLHTEETAVVEETDAVVEADDTTDAGEEPTRSRR